jgi:hypothetical protein
MRAPNQEGAETQRERIEQELRQLDREHDLQDEKGRRQIAEKQKMEGGREKTRTRAMDEERKELRRQDKMERAKREAREDFAQVKREGEKERRMQRKQETEGKERMRREADEKHERRKQLTQEARGMRSRNNNYGDETRPSQNDYSRKAHVMGDGSDDEEEESFSTQYNLEDYRKKAQQYAMMKLGTFSHLSEFAERRASFACLHRWAWFECRLRRAHGRKAEGRSHAGSSETRQRGAVLSACICVCVWCAS